jgi:hypothetical protein
MRYLPYSQPFATTLLTQKTMFLPLLLSSYLQGSTVSSPIFTLKKTTTTAECSLALLLSDQQQQRRILSCLLLLQRLGGSRIPQ